MLTPAGKQVKEACQHPPTQLKLIGKKGRLRIYLCRLCGKKVSDARPA